MKQEQFAAILPTISADLIAMITDKQRISEEKAIIQLYASKLYAALEQEETKLWQYSTHMLYALYEQEKSTGELRFPDV